MKKQLSILLILFAFVFTASAQENESRKINELKSTNYNCEIWMVAIDNLFIHLQENPQAKGFIIYYEGNYSVPINKNGKTEKYKSVLPRYGEANARIQAFRHFMKLRRFDESKVLFVNGSYKKEFTVEFWLVPKEAELPKPKPTLDKIEFRKGIVPDFYCYNL